MTKATIAAVIPVYNAEEYLDEFIESLNRQVVRPHQIIFVDDGSTDGTADHLLKLTQKFDYELITTQNHGVSHARNVGMKRVVSDYVTFLDADDEISPNFFNVFEELIKNNADVELLSASYTTDNSEFASKKDKIILESTVESGDEILVATLSGRMISGSPHAKLFQFDVIRENNIEFDENMTFYEDFDFFVRFVNVSRRVLLNGSMLYYYRQNSNSVMYQKFGKSRENSRVIEEQKIVSMSVKKPYLKVPVQLKRYNTAFDHLALQYYSNGEFDSSSRDMVNTIKQTQLTSFISKNVQRSQRIKAGMSLMLGPKLAVKLLYRLKRSKV